MRDLFLSECRRFKNAALIFAGVHLVVQLFLNRMVDFLQLRWELHMLALIVYMLAALAFALVQFGSYRQPSRWMWLLHRPLAPGAIFASITLASCVLILFGVGLPALLAVIGTDWLSTRTVDTRHYLMVAELVLLTMIAWMAGSYVILNRSRSAIVVLLLPFLMLAHLASGYALLLPSVVCLGLLAYVAFGLFKPDRAAPPKGWALVATAAPLQLGFYLALVWSGTFLYQNGQILLGVHPLNSTIPPAAGFTEASRADGRTLFLSGLAGATDPRAAQWRRQIPLLDIGNFEASGDRYPVRHQISNLDTLRFEDDKRKIEWTFSHDAMRYRGRDTQTSQDRGWLGLRGMGDVTPFPAVPVMPGPLFVMPQELHAWNAEAGTLHPLLRLSGAEVMASEPKRVDDMLYVVTNMRLIAYARPAQESGTAMLAERFSVQLPEPFSNLDRVDVAGLLDGTLMSITFGRAMVDGAGESAQYILFIDSAGQARLVAQRQLAHDFALLFEHHEWWVSPLLHALRAMPEALFDKGRILDKGKQRHTNALDMPRPRGVWIAALAAALLSALGAWAWLRRADIGAGRKAGWIAACLLLGPPSLACLMLLQARPPPLRQFAPPAAVPAAA